jgi:16S rRNA (guanine966-N2)-methyltransferase
MNSIFTKRYKYGKFPNLSKVEEDRKVYFKKKLDSPYLCIDSYEDGLTVSFTLNTIEYSFDKKEWHTLNVGETTPEVNAGSPIYFKGECRPGIAYGIGTFSISKRCGVSGNVLSLMFGDDFEYVSSLEGYKYAFTKLFDKCRISTCDYNQMLKGIAGKEQYDIIFIDPPYGLNVIPDILKKIDDYKIATSNAFVVCESGSNDIFSGNEELSKKYIISKQSRYSISYITVLRPNMEN